LTAILSIASCSDTWKLFRAAEDEYLLHMAISETDCPRLPGSRAITIPLIKRGEEMPQLILDFRSAGIYNWKSVVIIYDKTLDRDMANRVIKSITQQSDYNVKASGVSLIKLENNISRTDLKSVLSTIHPKTVGGNFMVIVSYELVESIMEYAKSLEMDFFIVVMQGGKTCHTEEVLEGFIKALDEAVQDEYDTAGQVSDEEWEAIRPTKLERRDYLLERVKKHLLKYGTCDNCTCWQMKTGETWGKEYQFSNLSHNSSSESLIDIISVGAWRPSDGPSMTDELFVHISHGFRGKNLPLVSFHNPPWQILKTNESGDVTEYKGLVFDIIKELSNNLNFTFTVEIVNKTTMNNTTGNTSLEITNIATNNIPSEFIDMIRNKTVALGAGAFTITEENKEVINFTNAISTQTYTFLVARPKELSRALLFISPFTGDVKLQVTMDIRTFFSKIDESSSTSDSEINPPIKKLKLDHTNETVPVSLYLIKEVNRSEGFSLLADESADISGKEQYPLDQATRTKAEQLSCSSSTPKFIICLNIIAKCSAQLEPVTNSLQGKSVNLLDVQKHIENLLQIFENNRKDANEYLRSIFTRSVEIADEFGIEIEQPRIARQENNDMGLIVKNTAETYNIENFEEESSTWIQYWDQCRLNNDDINMEFHDLLKKYEFFPAISQAIKIFLSMPPTTYTIERFFSILRRVKTWLRSTIGETRLTGTWLCLSLSIISMGPILYYIHRFSPVYEYKGIRKKGGLSSVQNCIWYMYGALLQQGSWWLVVLVVATTYCGNLVAFLTFPKIDIPITTIDELIAHKDTITWSFRHGSFLERQLKTSTESRFKILYDEGIKDVDIKDMILQVQNGKHVFIDWKIRLQYMMKKQYLQTDRCDLALGLDDFFDEQLALIVAQDTPYLPTINAEIKKLHQVGLIQKWLQDYLPKKDRCWKNRHIVEVNNHTVNMDDMQGSFFVLFFGFLLSILLLLVEKLCFKHSVKKKVKIIQPFTL
ncbi:hypothetical protein NQ314_005917, partial [Rhamnusium bicolor]